MRIIRKHTEKVNSMPAMTLCDTLKKWGCHCKNLHKQRMKHISMTLYTLYNKSENKKEGIHTRHECGFLCTTTGGIEGGSVIARADPSPEQGQNRLTNE